MIDIPATKYQTLKIINQFYTVECEECGSYDDRLQRFFSIGTASYESLIMLHIIFFLYGHQFNLKYMKKMLILRMKIRI